MGYLIKYYEIDGNSPVKDYLINCDDKVKAKISRQIAYLYEYGINPSIPRFKKLTGYNIWEARVLGKDNIRIFCCSHLGTIYILHIFRKKSQKTNNKDIKLGQVRYEKILTSNI